MARVRYYRVDNFRRRELQYAMRPLGATEIEIESVLRQYRGRRWDRTAVGRHINLTFARWQLLGKQAKRGGLGLRHIWPGDRTAEQMRQYMKDRRRDADRERKRRDRMSRNINPKIKGISPRARILAAVLADEWTESRSLLDSVKPRWRNSAGEHLKSGTAAKALQKAARELCEAGVAEQKIEVRHGHAVRFLRWSPASIFRREDFIEIFDERTRLFPRGTFPGEKNLSAQRRCAAKPGISDPGLLVKTARPLESLSSSERTRSPSKRRGPMVADEEGADAAVSYGEV